MKAIVSAISIMAQSSVMCNVYNQWRNVMAKCQCGAISSIRPAINGININSNVMCQLNVEMWLNLWRNCNE